MASCFNVLCALALLVGIFLPAGAADNYALQLLRHAEENPDDPAAVRYRLFPPPRNQAHDAKLAEIIDLRVRDFDTREEAEEHPLTQRYGVAPGDLVYAPMDPFFYNVPAGQRIFVEDGQRPLIFLFTGRTSDRTVPGSPYEREHFLHVILFAPSFNGTENIWTVIGETYWLPTHHRSHPYSGNVFAAFPYTGQIPNSVLNTWTGPVQRVANHDQRSLKEPVSRFHAPFKHVGLGVPYFVKKERDEHDYPKRRYHEVVAELYGRESNADYWRSCTISATELTGDKTASDEQWRLIYCRGYSWVNLRKMLGNGDSKLVITAGDNPGSMQGLIFDARPDDEKINDYLYELANP